MNITKFLGLSLLFLAFILTTPSASSPLKSYAIHSEDDLPEPVFDINGQELRAGGRYFVEVLVPPLPNASSLLDKPVLAFSDISGGRCPDLVVLSTKTKFPVIISPVRSGDSVIRENSYLTIKFDMRYSCRMYISLIWGIVEIKSESLLMSKGVEWFDQFKVTKYENEKNTYRLSYCTPLAGTECRRLGFVVKNGVSYVSPDGSSLPILFRPALEPRNEIWDMIKAVVRK